jgi:hypothetical protein
VPRKQTTTPKETTMNVTTLNESAPSPEAPPSGTVSVAHRTVDHEPPVHELATNAPAPAEEVDEDEGGAELPQSLAHLPGCVDENVGEVHQELGKIDGCVVRIECELGAADRDRFRPILKDIERAIAAMRRSLAALSAQAQFAAEEVEFVEPEEERRGRPE